VSARTEPDSATLTYPFARQAPLRTPVEYARLRADRPVAPAILPTGSTVWLVTRYDDVLTVLSDSRFSRAALTRPDAPRVSPIPLPPHALFTTDPPEHTRLRALVSRSFTARATERMRVRVRQLVTDLLDVLAAGPQPADLIDTVVYPLPVAFICDLLGVPPADRGNLRDWSDRIFAIDAYPQDEVLEAYQSLGGYLDGLLDDKRSHPGEDMLSSLVTAGDDEGSLDQADLIVLTMTLLMVGYPTTVDTLSCSLLSLLLHPRQYAALAGDPALLEPAVEELLRLNPPSSNLSDVRVTTEEVRLGGVLIPAGAGVVPCYTSANRDENRFADPERLDIRRDGPSHLAFGYGPHYCLGAALARVEIQEVVRALVTRFPALALAVPLEQVPWRESLFGVEVQRLQVTW